jgi:hypothetical protein
MKIDWSQMNGFWVHREEREPPSPGEYYVTLDNTGETLGKWDGGKWHLLLDEEVTLGHWPVYWWDDVTDPLTGKYKKTSPL